MYNYITKLLTFIFTPVQHADTSMVEQTFVYIVYYTTQKLPCLSLSTK